MTLENVEKQLTEEKRHSKDQHSGKLPRKPDLEVLLHLSENLGAFIIGLECRKRHRSNGTGSDKRENSRSLARNQPPLVSLTLSCFHGEKVRISSPPVANTDGSRPRMDFVCTIFVCTINSTST